MTCSVALQQVVPQPGAKKAKKSRELIFYSLQDRRLLQLQLLRLLCVQDRLTAYFWKGSATHQE